MARKVELVPYSPIWEKYLEKEEQNLRNILRNNLIEVIHVGSTAIPTISAVPTLDILCVVHTLDGISLFKNEFERRGLSWRKDYEIKNRLYLERISPVGDSHLSHIHILDKSNEEIMDFIDFKEYLIQEPEVAKKYHDLKVSLKEKHGDNIDLYDVFKSDFIKMILSNLKK